MKVYVKSAGHKDTQDYVWICVGDRADPAETELLGQAERKTTNRGNVVSWVDSTSHSKRVLFIGNATSGRVDFYGTPIRNHIGLIIDPKIEDELRLANQIAKRWMNSSSRLARILRESVVASDDDCGFRCDSDILGRLMAVGEEVEDSSSAALQEEDGKRAHSSKETGKDTHMHISIHTVPSGEQDYEWCFGGRPTYADRLWDVAERVRTTDSNKVYFAILAHEAGKWILFIRDIVGKDTIVRPARDAGCAMAIEISDQNGGADKTRRLLAAWLDSDDKLKKILLQTVDRSGAEVKVDKEKLYDAVEKLLAGDTCPLEADELLDSSNPCIVRLAKDLSDRMEMRRLSAEYVRKFKFPSKDGVHFMFASTPYSSRPNHPDRLPDTLAHLIVIGHRDDERGEGGESIRQIIKRGKFSPERPPEPPPHDPWYIEYKQIEIVAAVVTLVVLLIFSIIRGCDSDEPAESDQNKAIVSDMPNPSTSTNTKYQ